MSNCKLTEQKSTKFKGKTLFTDGPDCIQSTAVYVSEKHDKTERPLGTSSFGSMAGTSRTSKRIFLVTIQKVATTSCGRA